MNKPIISADSHITEPGWTYVDNVDPAFRDRAPFLTDRLLPLPFIALSRAAAVSGASPASWYR